MSNVMLKYVKIINTDTMECQVGLGTDAEYYKSMGMFLMEVEQSVSGKYYIAGFLPQEDIEVLRSKKRKELRLKRDIYKEENNFSDHHYSNIEYGIIDVSEEEFLKLKNFLKALVKKYDNYKNMIIEAKTIEELNAINIDFNIGNSDEN